MIKPAKLIMKNCLRCGDAMRQTWSRICLRRTLDHRAAGQTGQHHGGHDLVHLHGLGAAEAEERIQ